MNRGALRVVAWCAGGTAVFGAALLACVLADPPPLQELPPPMRPVIVHPSVDPPLGVIGLQPDNAPPMKFSVPIQVDPNETLQWRVFIDLHRTTSPPPALLKFSFDQGVGGDGGTTVTFDINFAADLDPTICHTIDFVVANLFINNTTFAADPQDPPGGDGAKWTYEPLGNCNVYDAGPMPEAGPDASDASDASDAGDGASE